AIWLPTRFWRKGRGYSAGVHGDGGQKGRWRGVLAGNGPTRRQRRMSKPMSDDTRAAGDEGVQVVPDDLVGLIQQRDGAAKLLQELPRRYSCHDVADTTLRPGPGSAHNVWETCGYTYFINGRVHEAVAVFQGLYDQLLSYQEATGKRAHKGSPLVFLSDCYARLNYRVIARRFLMLGLCEDAIQNKGVTRPEATGVYFRAVWGFGLADRQVRHYTSLSWDIFRLNRKAGRFPEWLLQELDHHDKDQGIQE